MLAFFRASSCLATLTFARPGRAFVRLLGLKMVAVSVADRNKVTRKTQSLPVKRKSSCRVMRSSEHYCTHWIFFLHEGNGKLQAQPKVCQTTGPKLHRNNFLFFM